MSVPVLMRPLVGLVLLLSPQIALAQGTQPPADSDTRLELIVRAAYGLAAAHARANGNYFAADGDTGALEQAIESRLSPLGIAVEAAVVTDTALLARCVTGPVTLRIAPNIFGDGLTLTAVSSRRAVTYRYEPRESAELIIEPPVGCTR
jgi:hypothetical protein